MKIRLSLSTSDWQNSAFANPPKHYTIFNRCALRVNTACFASRWYILYRHCSQKLYALRTEKIEKPISHFSHRSLANAEHGLSTAEK